MENEIMPEAPKPATSENEVINELRTETVTPRSVGKSLAREALLLAGAILLGSLIIAGAILTLSPKSGTTGTDTAKGSAPVAAAGNQNPQDTTATTSLDDDPVLGDRTKARVAIVEFSDYECPYCKQFHANTFDALVKEYVDTGKAVIAFRDFPLSFHDPNATMEAATAECVRKEKGDKAYFAFGKSLYENTQANGKGLVAGMLDKLIGKVGANPTTVNACATTEAVKQEITKDIADGSKAGISGTPSFIIGNLAADGTVTGERVVGAMPLTGANGFAPIIDKYLSK